MKETTGSFRLSTARRGGPKENPTLILAVVAVLVAIILIVALNVDDTSERPVGPTPTPRVTGTPTPAPTRTPTPGVERAQGDWVDATVVMPPTPTPTMPTLEAYPTRAPRPTPSISQCAVYRFSTTQVFSPSAQVKIDIRVDNRCPYDLGPNNLLFEITGRRGGAHVQSVRGVPFETIRRGRSGDLSIGLPGSEDWYDEIEVTVFD
ncbi:MAG: hypothetical protein AB1Z65_12255 [Candidatus Sulfomarinibacteraceae bacterium]